MVEIPDSLRSVFSATIAEQDGAYVVELPAGDLEQEAVRRGETYRIAILEPVATEGKSPQAGESPSSAQQPRQGGPPEPPVEEGERREVTIATLGDQGDGIANVERGSVVIVPETQPGEQPTIEIEEVRQNVAFASVIASDGRTL